MEFILGIDGGATKTKVQIADLSGKVVSEAVSGPSNYKSIGINEAETNIVEAILNSKDKIESFNKIFFISACLGFAGLDDDEGSKIYKSIIRNKKIYNYFIPEKIFICNDSKIAFAAGSDFKY